MSKAEELADKLNSLCVAEFAWPHLNDAATELRRLSVESEMRRALAQDSMQKLRALDASHQRLLGALEQAKNDLEEWGGYVPDYFKNKHNFDADLEAISAAIKQAKELS